MHKLFFPLIAFSLTLTACSTVLNNLPGVYTLDIQQGNMVDQDMIDQLRPSMTKKQVLYIMGTPMLMDVFHQKRWDYLYSKQVAGEDREQKRLSLFFEGDILTGIQGDFRPDSQAVKKVKETTVDVPERDLEKTMWEKFVWLFSDEPERRSVDSTAAPEDKKPDNKSVTDDLKASEPVSATPILVQ
jgi:outer membrane protein assembly factor BamE